MNVKSLRMLAKGVSLWYGQEKGTSIKLEPFIHWIDRKLMNSDPNKNYYIQHVPNCAITKAVDDETISFERWQNYQKLLMDTK